MRFNPAAFNRLLSPENHGLGQRLLWRRALPCPCDDQFSGAPQQGCPICEGRGFSWGKPKNAWTGLAGQKATRQWATSGAYENGDMVVTIPEDSPFYAAGERDRATMTDSTQPFNQKMRRGEFDRLGPANRTATIERVSWIVDGELVDAAPHGQPSVILSHNGTPYLSAEGFAYLAPTTPGEVLFPSIREDGELVWRDGGGPRAGQGYVVQGRRHPEYTLLQDLPQDRAHSGGLPLPRRCVLRLFDMTGR